jgi:hypothetical protein
MHDERSAHMARRVAARYCGEVQTSLGILDAWQKV